MSSSTSSSTATGDGDDVPPLLIPSLPDDVAVNCLARVPRYQHPTLSLVSKPFRSVLSSSQLFTTRAAVGSAEDFLYLSLRLHEHRTIQFFTLTRTSRNPHLLLQLPPVPFSFIGSAYATVGPKIYVIGGSVHDVASAHVWILDCRFHRWEPGPKMRVAREFAAAGVVDGKIYVIGGCAVDTWARSANWAEVFDPAVGKWAAVPSPADIREKWMHASAVVEGKVYAMADRGGLVYDPRIGAWESAEADLDYGWRGRAAVVDGVLYCYDYLGKIRGFDVKLGLWKELKRLEKELPRFLCGATMANLGGNLVVVWEGKGKGVEIWCAEIEIEKRKDGELWGKVCWSDRVLSVSNGSSIVHCLAVTL